MKNQIENYGNTYSSKAVFKRSSIALFLCFIIILGFFSCHKEPFPFRRLGNPSAFTLTGPDGQAYHYKPDSGKVRLVFFGYTQCPDYCPATMSKLKKVYAKLSLPKDELPETIFISVDSDRDTPEILDKYLKSFEIPAIGLTGDKATLEEIARDFKTFFFVEKKGNDTVVDHATFLYLIDPEGTIRYSFRNQDSADFIYDGIRSLYHEMN